MIEVTLNLPGRSRILTVTNDGAADEKVGYYECRWVRPMGVPPFRVDAYPRELGAEVLVAVALLRSVIPETKRPGDVRRLLQNLAEEFAEG